MVELTIQDYQNLRAWLLVAKAEMTLAQSDVMKALVQRLNTIIEEMTIRASSDNATPRGV